MLEMLFNPKKAERKPWEMLFIGILYGGLAILISEFMFANDIVLSEYRGVLTVSLAVFFSLPFMYFLIKYEEKKDEVEDRETRLLEEHSKAIKALLWLFLGFILAFAIIHIALPSNDHLKAQIQTFCSINRPTQYAECLAEHGVEKTIDDKITGYSSSELALNIFSNNIIVLIVTLALSLILGAGAIFILVWNASVIAAAMGIFTDYNLLKIPAGLLRYMIHGVPELAAYTVGALAGGIISTAVIRHEYNSDKFWDIVQDGLDLVIISIIILVFAALIEVYVTPIIF